MTDPLASLLRRVPAALFAIAGLFAIVAACTGRIETVLVSANDGGGVGPDAGGADSAVAPSDADALLPTDAAVEAGVVYCSLKGLDPCGAGLVCVGYESSVGGVGTCMRRCGAGTGVTCGDSEYCYQPGANKATACSDDASAPSVCRVKWPFSSPPPVALLPVCGCDGKTYNHSIFAAQSGVNVRYDGPCGVCTSDPECNRDTGVSSLKGACDTSLGSPGRCVCNPGAAFDAPTGKCY